MPDERLLDKARNLLSLAENAGTDAEAETAREKAEALMLRHSIDSALLAEATQPADREHITTRHIVIEAPYASQKDCILAAVVDVNQVRAVRLTHRSGGGIRCALVGYPSDLQRVEMLFTSLLIQASRHVMRARPAWRGENTSSYRASWILGFAQTVATRLERLHGQQKQDVEATEATGRGTELVLADRKHTVDAAFADLFPHTTRGRKARSTGMGHGAGAQAGARADLGQTRLAGGRRALPR